MGIGRLKREEMRRELTSVGADKNSEEGYFPRLTSNPADVFIILSTPISFNWNNFILHPNVSFPFRIEKISEIIYSNSSN